jgi:hypothetical protein
MAHPGQNADCCSAGVGLRTAHHRPFDRGEPIAMRMFQRSATWRPAALAAALAIAACSSDAAKLGPSPPNYAGPADNRSPTARPPGDDSGVLFSSGTGNRSGDHTPGAGENGLGVNAYLWRGALDTIGFMPLLSADPFDGVILTDWYIPPGVSGERFKAAVYVLGRDLRSDGVRVNINRQVEQNGQWVDASMAPSTVADIENKILARARRMRERSQAGG